LPPEWVRTLRRIPGCPANARADGELVCWVEDGGSGMAELTDGQLSAVAEEMAAKLSFDRARGVWRTGKAEYADLRMAFRTWVRREAERRSEQRKARPYRY
jgi:hypothetical protein